MISSKFQALMKEISYLQCQLFWLEMNFLLLPYFVNFSYLKTGDLKSPLDHVLTSSLAQYHSKAYLIRSLNPYSVAQSALVITIFPSSVIYIRGASKLLQGRLSIHHIPPPPPPPISPPIPPPIPPSIPPIIIPPPSPNPPPIIKGIPSPIPYPPPKPPPYGLLYGP